MPNSKDSKRNLPTSEIGLTKMFHAILRARPSFRRIIEIPKQTYDPANEPVLQHAEAQMIRIDRLLDDTRILREQEDHMRRKLVTRR